MSTEAKAQYSERRSSSRNRDEAPTKAQMEGMLSRLINEGKFTEGDDARTALKSWLKLQTATASTEGQPADTQPITDKAPTGGEATPETDPSLLPYKAHYDLWPEGMQKKHPWEAVRIRLLTDTAEGGEPLITAASGLVEAVFFSMDAEGNPLFADGKEDPRDLPHCGLGYKETRQLVRFKENGEGKQVPTGYQMFPYKQEEDSKSEEILAFEGFTGKDFVRSRDGNEWVESWVESGENPSWPRLVNFYPSIRSADVRDGDPGSDPERGVRRLLRGQRV